MRKFDCITFFQENFITNLRLEILRDVVDYFIICESCYDHRGNKKKINFQLSNPKLKNKVRHIILDHPFPDGLNLWQRQAYQREYIFNGIKDSDEEDYIMFSDPDEIPRPEVLKNFKLTKKYAIFHQKCFNYKLNLLNPHETPWSGTRLTKKKNLFSFDFFRQKVLEKNIKKWWKFGVERNIEIIDNAGWHFNNLFSPEMISTKLKTFAHDEFSNDEFTDIKIIEKKINEGVDLFNRGQKYKKINIDNTYPKFILDRLSEFKKFIV